MADKMPTVEEIEVMADFMLGFDPGFHNEKYVLSMHNKCAVMLRTIAEHMRKSEPVAEVVEQDTKYHGYARAIKHLYPRSRVGWRNNLLAPGTKLYTTPLAEAEDARRYRWLRSHSVFANDSMRELWFDRSLDRGGMEELDKSIDAEMKGEGHG